MVQITALAGQSAAAAQQQLPACDGAFGGGCCCEANKVAVMDIDFGPYSTAWCGRVGRRYIYNDGDTVCGVRRKGRRWDRRMR